MTDKTPEERPKATGTLRDLLEHWAKWWNGPGREDYRGNILPPLTKTGEALKCFACSDMPPGEWCRCCYREEK